MKEWDVYGLGMLFYLQKYKAWPTFSVFLSFLYSQFLGILFWALKGTPSELPST